MATKKIFILFSILMSMVVTRAFAYDIAVENDDGVTIYYNYINDGKELAVDSKDIHYNSYSGKVVIPAGVTYEGQTFKVTVIGISAFNSCSDLTSVTIPSSVTIIYGGAFAYCSKLTTITIPESVTIIADGAFRDCTSLISVNIPSGVTSIAHHLFLNCRNLTSIHIPSNVTSIADMAFQGSGLKSVTIPNSVTSIGASAFSGCSNLTTVTIGSGVTKIGYNAFDGYFILDSIVSLIKEPFPIQGKKMNVKTFNIFSYNQATLYVPAGTIEKYKNTAGWKDFAHIEEFTGDDTPEPKKCESPTISYLNGKLSFNSATEGATYQYSITDSDIKSGSADEVQLGVTYNISVYATKEGYENSEVATATLCWIDAEPMQEGTKEAEDNVTEVKAMPVLIQANDGVLNITGAPEGATVCVFDISGRQLGTTTATNGITKLAIPTTDKVAIVKIGEKSVKVSLK